MGWLVRNVWLIPALPLVAAGITSLLKQRHRKPAAALAIGSMGLAFFLSCAAFVETLGGGRQVHKFRWFEIGTSALELGWVLDPLTAVMLVMVTFVGLLIFIYSTGYMAHDENSTRFFCFLSLFAAAMLGLVISNSLLLLFMCWEVVGLASYLLIGFWYHKPSAAAAAKKAFITTRIGDIGFFLGLLWLYKETGALLFYDGGQGCLEQGTLTTLMWKTIGGGMAVSTAISLLIFCGAIGKSGQVPLHVWLPDAMEGPTPVSALIHAATMVAAGVFLVARVYPLMAVSLNSLVVDSAIPMPSTALQVVTWIGAITAVFAALIAVAQTDIKRILAYSTVSQLGFMFVGLGVGGVAVGMFHLITHAFFKALLFLGAGSVIHGCHEEQDIRRMGGLRKLMPVTFVTYAVGMMALSGFPLLFSGFWSKDEILHSAWQWPVSKGPFVLAAFGALLTAFYMTRQMCYVFFGSSRTGVPPVPTAHDHSRAGQAGRLSYEPHESPRVMTVPLAILAVFAVLLGFLGTPAWPWFQSFLNGEHAHLGLAHLSHALPTMLLSALIVAVGVGTGWGLYGRKPMESAEQRDILQQKHPTLFRWLRDKFYVDELYARTVIALNADGGRLCDFFDRWVWGGLVKLVSFVAQGFSDLTKLLDDLVVNGGFDAGCRRVTGGAKVMSALQDGQVQNYLRVIALAVVVLALAFLWGCK